MNTINKTWSRFNIESIEPLQTINRFDDVAGNRFYYWAEDGQIRIAAGVTSAFGIVSTERKAIDLWKENNPDWPKLLKLSSDYGTLLHEVYGDIMMGNKISEEKLKELQRISEEGRSSHEMPAKDILSFLKFKEDMNLKPLIIEGMLLWRDEDGEYLAMTIDLLAEISYVEKVKRIIHNGTITRGKNKGKPRMESIIEEQVTKKTVLIDFKSNFFEKEKKSFYESHLMQLLAASLAVEQNFGIKVDGLYNYAGNAWRTEPSYTLYQHNIEEKSWDIFFAYWNLIKVKGYNKPQGRIFVPGVFNNSQDYKIYSYEEYVLELINREEPGKEREGGESPSLKSNPIDQS